MSDLTRRIDAIIGRLERLTTKMPGAVDALLDRRRKIDGWPTGGGDVHVQCTAELTAVEAAVAQRLDCEGFVREYNEELDAIRLIALNLERKCDGILRNDLPDEPKPRCDGGVGYEGYLIARSDGGWSNPGCYEIPDDGRKTCNRCRGAASSWKRARSRVVN